MTVELKIAKTVYGGDGIGRLGDGRVCFVPGAFAGETVRAELVEQKKKFVRARLVEVVEALPGRAAAPRARVPGMVYADVSYEDEIRFKRDQLENFLQKIDRGGAPVSVTPAPKPLNYRNKVVYHTERQNGRWTLGYRAEPEHRVVDVLEDPLACPAINAALPEIRSSVFTLLTQGPRAARQSAKAADNVTIRWTPLDGVKWWLGDAPSSLVLHERTCGRTFAVSAGGFYQVNPDVCELMVKAVRGAYGETAKELPHVLDLYCGVGVLGLGCLAGTAAAGEGQTARLVGVESGRDAVAMAKANAAALGVKGSFFCERVGANLGSIKFGPRHVMIVDPPRGGMEPNVPSWLVRRQARRIVYVSCDPATLTRDLQTLAGAYRVERAMLFDMFPRTARFETVVLLSRREDAGKAVSVVSKEAKEQRK